MGILTTLFGYGKPQKPPSTQTINPAELLYSVATLCDELPALDQIAPVATGTTVMHEDDWRQVEFVDAKNRLALEQKLAEYISFRNAHRKGLGFTGVFVRKDTYPSIESLAIKTVRLGTNLPPLAVVGQLVRGGFSVKDPSGAYLYGQAKPDGTIVNLGIEPPRNVLLGDEFTKIIISIASEHGLILADWYKGVLVETVTADALRQWAELYKPTEH